MKTKAREKGKGTFLCDDDLIDQNRSLRVVPSDESTRGISTST